MNAPRGLALIATVLTLAGCGSGPVAVRAPHPDAQAVRACKALFDRLPETLDGKQRRETQPSTPLTAAWGSPAIVVRCGVAEPKGLRPTSQLAVVNDVEWFPEPDRSPLRFTTVHRVARVELQQPREYGAPAAVLVDLAGPIKASVPPR